MKTKLLIFCLLLSLNLFSQMKDLLTLAEGKIVYNSVLYDSEENLFGYIYLYEKVFNEKYNTMRFIILDKNLNEVSSGSFKNNKYDKVKGEYYDCTMMGDYVVLNKAYYYIKTLTPANKNPFKLLLITFQTISLKDNTSSAEFTYDGKFTNFSADYNTMKSDYKGNETKYMINGFDNGTQRGFFINNNNKEAYNEKSIQLFNEKMENIWSFNFNEYATENNYNSFSYLHLNNNTLYIAVSKIEKRNFNSLKSTETKIVAIDLKTGKTKYEYVLQNNNSKYKHKVVLKEYDGNLFITGSFFANKTVKNKLESLGIFKISLNENGIETSKAYHNWRDFSIYNPFEYDGKLSGNQFLNIIKYYITKDGSIYVLAEKINKLGLTHSDYIILTMDQDFIIDNVYEIQKPTKSVSGYLFSQYIDNNTGVVFYYKYYIVDISKKDQKVLLGINTILNGSLSEKKIEYDTNDDFDISFYPSKEDHILLREFSKNKKYYQIRIEDLNN